MTEETERLCYEFSRAVCEMNSNDNTYFSCKWPTCDCRTKKRILRINMILHDLVEIVRSLPEEQIQPGEETNKCQP